jgi:hypothetical protein
MRWLPAGSIGGGALTTILTYIARVRVIGSGYNAHLMEG